MGRKYANPPIIEVLCEIQFDPTSDWNIITPGLIYNALKDNFPRQGSSKTVNLGFFDNGSMQFRPIDLVQFIKQDSSALVQIGQNLLIYNQLAPYSSWGALLPDIENVLSKYLSEAKPKAIYTIKLRYIDRIELPTSLIKSYDYFKFRPQFGQDFPTNISSFLLGVELSYKEGRDKLKISMGNSENNGSDTDNEEKTVLILDYEYIMVKPGEIDLSEVSSWLSVAHDEIEKAYETSITDLLREKFGLSMEE